MLHHGRRTHTEVTAACGVALRRKRPRRDPEPMKHFLTLLDLEADQLKTLLQEAARMKAAHLKGERPQVLAGKVLGLVFEKPSLRTRVSFEAAMTHLGGASIFLSSPDGAIGVRE